MKFHNIKFAILFSILMLSSVACENEDILKPVVDKQDKKQSESAEDSLVSNSKHNIAADTALMEFTGKGSVDHLKTMSKFIDRSRKLHVVQALPEREIEELEMKVSPKELYSVYQYRKNRYSLPTYNSTTSPMKPFASISMMAVQVHLALLQLKINQTPEEEKKIERP